jgi:hypothetical protein
MTSPRDSQGNSNILMLGESQVENLIAIPPTNNPKTAVVFSMWQASPKTLMMSSWRETKLRRSGYKTLWAAVDEKSALRFKAIGLKAKALQANMFCREDIFKPIGGTTKLFDAIYCASLEEYKRPWLAHKISSLQIVARNYKENLSDLAKKYGLEHAVINEIWVNREELVTKINQSHCGLALSKKEGSMLATTDYLLCGIPVVTTPSSGGRDLWYTNKNHIICQDNPEAIANAVERCKEKLALGLLGTPEEIAHHARRIQSWERSKLAIACKDHFDLWLDKESLKPGKYNFYVPKDDCWEKVDIKNNPNP